MEDNSDGYRRLLVESTRVVLSRFFQTHSPRDLIAIGYVFELWNASPQFDLCAHTGSHHDERLEIRWNSGDYNFPAGLLGTIDELGPEWGGIVERLHQEAEDQDQSGEVYRALTEVACGALIEVAREGILGDTTKLDFNVSEVNDPLELVMERDRLIHLQI